MDLIVYSLDKDILNMKVMLYNIGFWLFNAFNSSHIIYVKLLQYVSNRFQIGYVNYQSYIFNKMIQRIKHKFFYFIWASINLLTMLFLHFTQIYNSHNSLLTQYSINKIS